MNHPHTLLLMIAGLTMLPSASQAQHCSWTAGQDKIGLACDGSMEFSGIVISCEQSPLYLWVATDCGSAKTCSAALEIDGESLPIGQATYVEDGYSGVTVPLESEKWLLARLAKARYLKTIIAGKPSLTLTVEGLHEAIRSLTAACRETAAPVK